MSTPQYAFEIQFSMDLGFSWASPAPKAYTDSSTFIAPANTLVPIDPTGAVGWRVRTYNLDNVASDWSEPAWFIVDAAPQVPSIISVEPEKSRPLTRWQSTGQIAFQLQFRAGERVVFDTGERYGEDKEYSLKANKDPFLPNGSYVAFLRIQNRRGLWSDWAEYPVSINAAGKLQVTLTVTAVDNAAKLNWTVGVRL